MVERAIAEKPIIFSAPMVRAILEDRKYATRRICKPAHDTVGKDTAWAVCPAKESGWIAWLGLPRPDIAEFTKYAYEHGFPCPYGSVGDRLWVKENWQAIHVYVDPETGYGDDIIVCKKIPKDDGSEYNDIYEGRTKPYWSVVYAATDPAANDHRDDRGFAWRPSIFMPRWASRITLEITGVRVERLQDISEEDAKAEGVEITNELTGCAEDLRGSYREAFSALWDRINEDRAPWKSNPWVWVVEFKRLAEEEGKTVMTEIQRNLLDVALDVHMTTTGAYERSDEDQQRDIEELESRIAKW